MFHSISNAICQLCTPFGKLDKQWLRLVQTTPYSLKTGNTVDFLSRTINKSFHDYFPLNTQTQETAVPTYREQLPGNASDKLFHFDSLRHLNLLPRNLLTIRVRLFPDLHCWHRTVLTPISFRFQFLKMQPSLASAYLTTFVTGRVYTL